MFVSMRAYAARRFDHDLADVIDFAGFERPFEAGRPRNLKIGKAGLAGKSGSVPPHRWRGHARRYATRRMQGQSKLPPTARQDRRPVLNASNKPLVIAVVLKY